MATDPLDPTLHQPLRTQIVAYLSSAGELTFSELKTRLDVSDGNMDSHMKKLVASGYVTSRRETGHGRPQTFFALTAAGKAALHAYILALQSLLDLSDGDAAPRAAHAKPVGAQR